jgi:hypothetical protein
LPEASIERERALRSEILALNPEPKDASEDEPSA